MIAANASVATDAGQTILRMHSRGSVGGATVVSAHGTLTCAVEAHGFMWGTYEAEYDVFGTSYIAAREIVMQRISDSTTCDGGSDYSEPEDCSPGMPAPQIAVTGTEDYEAGGSQWTRYELTVTNRQAFAPELFQPAPNLPPCGLNSNSSRTWVSIYDQDNGYIYGFCALGVPEDLQGIWFSVPRGDQPPAAIYVTLEDRRCNTTRVSNLLALR